MKVNLPGLLENVAHHITRPDGTSPNGWAHSLRELRANIDALAREPSRWPEFADLYCLPKSTEDVK